MKNHVKVLGTLAILAAAGGLLYAQTKPGLNTKVAFAFSAGGKTFEAALYEIRHSDASSSVLTFRNADTGKTEMVPFVTRLGSRQGDKGALVFDKEGSQYILTEIHVPGADGYLLKGAAGQHTHETVPAAQ
jgi:hypothetical protein